MIKHLLTLLLVSVPSAVFATGVVSFSTTTLTLEEAPVSNTPKTVTIVRTGNTSAAVEVTVLAESIAGVTPVSASVAVLECRPDASSAWKALYWGGSLMVTIPAGASSTTFEMRSRDNNAFEGNGVSGNLAITQLSGTATKGALERIPVTINNDDFDITLVPTPISFTEGNGSTPVDHQIQIAASRPIALAAASSPFMMIMSGFSGSMATIGVDVLVPPGAAPAGLLPYSSAFSIPITVIPDNQWEGDETFYIDSLSWTYGWLFIGPGTMLTIIDDDDPVTASVSAPAPVMEGATGTTALMEFTVTLSRAYTEWLAVRAEITGGTAQNGDYSVVSVFDPFIGFAPGETTKKIVLSVTGDGAPEPDETIQITLSRTDPLAVPMRSAEIGTATATGTIIDDDSLPSLVVGTAGSALVTEGSSTSLQLSLSSTEGIPAVTPSVSYTVNAPAGTVITPSSGVVTFDSSSPVTLSFHAGNDNVPELDVPVTITFSNPSQMMIGQAVWPLFTVKDNDRYTPSVSSPTVVEGNAGSSVLAFMISVPYPALRDLQFTYATVTGTAGEADFTPASGAIAIPAGQTQATVAVMVTGDTGIEPDEVMTLSVSSTDALVAAGSFTGTGTILLDDYGNPPAPDATLVTEAAGSQGMFAWFSVKMPAHPFPVTCSVTTRNGTATTAGGDYLSLTGTLTFAAGETQKWVAVSVTPGTGEEPVEQFFLDVTHTATGAVRSSACTIERLSVSQFWRVFPGLYAVRFPSGLGQRYIVYEAGALGGPWIPSSSILTGTGFPVTQTLFSDAPASFYRVELAPPLPPGTPALGPQ